MTKYSEISEQVYDGLWNVYSESLVPATILKKTGEVIEVNNAMEELIGYSSDILKISMILCRICFPTGNTRTK